MLVVIETRDESGEIVRVRSWRGALARVLRILGATPVRRPSGIDADAAGMQQGNEDGKDQLHPATLTRRGLHVSSRSADAGTRSFRFADRF